MRKTILTLTLAALLLAGCAEVPENVKKESSAVESSGESSAAFDGSGLYGLDLSKYAHISPAEDMLIIESEVEKLCRFDLTYPVKDYSTYREELAAAFLGDDCDPSYWSSVSDGLGETWRYTDPNSKADLVCGDSGNFGYTPDAENSWIISKSGRIPVDPDKPDRTFRLLDGSEITLEKAAQAAVEGFDKLDKAIGREPSQLNGITYDDENGLLIFDFLPRCFGLRLSIHSLDFEREEDSFSGSDLLKNAMGFSRRTAVVYGEGGRCEISEYIGEVEPAAVTEEYDKALTLSEALEHFDSSCAPNVSYELISAELKYIIAADDITGAGAIRTYGVPAWELILFNKTQQRRYLCAIDAQTGEISLAKMKENVL